jgi:hypothetical protein
VLLLVVDEHQEPSIRVIERVHGIDSFPSSGADAAAPRPAVLRAPPATTDQASGGSKATDHCWLGASCGHSLTSLGRLPVAPIGDMNPSRRHGSCPGAAGVGQAARRRGRHLPIRLG